MTFTAEVTRIDFAFRGAVRGARTGAADIYVVIAFGVLTVEIQFT
jgi:hypothetical protein